jgi:tripartite-type tricarboxylate transporter receptor subunit TctC
MAQPLAPFVRSAVIGACLMASAFSASAQQGYPNRPLRLIVPLAAGGTTDILARTMSPQLSAGLGQSIVVENRGGAGGVVGSELVAKSPADGYTLLLISGDSYNVNAAMYGKLPFDARKDLKPVALLAASPNMLSVHPSLPVRSVKELVVLSKAWPKDLNYGVS